MCLPRTGVPTASTTPRSFPSHSTFRWNECDTAAPSASRTATNTPFAARAREATETIAEAVLEVEVEPGVATYAHFETLRSKRTSYEPTASSVAARACD